jgi:hypothetical protein
VNVFKWKVLKSFERKQINMRKEEEVKLAFKKSNTRKLMLG